MPKYSVKVRVVKVLQQPLFTHAPTPEKAIEKVEKIVLAWKDIEEVQGFDATEEM